MTLRLTDGKLTAVAVDSVSGSDTELTLSVTDTSTDQTESECSNGLIELISQSLTSLQHKHGYIRDERSRVESYPYPVKKGQRYINLNPGRLLLNSHSKK